MIRSSRQAVSLRYDQKARLALAGCVLLAVLALLGAVQAVAGLVSEAQADFNLARAAIAAGQATGYAEAEAMGAAQVLPGRSLADVQGAAQVQLKTLAERNEAVVASLHVTTGDGRGNLRPVRLRAVLSVPEHRLAVLLAELASAQPLLALETFEAQPETAMRGAQTPEAMLSVRLDAVGFARLGGGRP